MNVLSLFDGMSCGQQALERIGIKVQNYFASEIDKYAIEITKKNYPNTVHLGDVRNVTISNLPKIDLLIGGSPCQSFSFAGKRKGMSTKDNIEILTLKHYLQLKEQNFEFEGQSYLFWEYIRLLNEVKPKYFLLENVIMGEKWEKVLSKAIGVNPIEINSTLVSAQNRRRLYWTNIGHNPGGLFGDLICEIQQPKDKGILLKDILQPIEEIDNKYFLKENHPGKIKDINQKASCFTAGGNSGGNHSDMDLIVYNNDRLNKTIKKHSKNIENNTLIDSYNQAIYKDKSITINTRVNASNNTHIYQEFILAGDYRRDEGFRWRESGKSGTLLAQARQDGTAGQALVNIKGNIRRLTPVECERLQTVKDNYTQGVSDSQRYKMLGNGWTVDVIAHIFSYLKND